MEVTRRKYLIPQDKKKRNKKNIPYENEEMGRYTEGSSLQELGECVIKRRGETEAEIVFVKLRARDKVRRELEDRRTLAKMEVTTYSNTDYLQKQRFQRAQQRHAEAARPQSQLPRLHPQQLHLQNERASRLRMLPLTLRLRQSRKAVSHQNQPVLAFS